MSSFLAIKKVFDLSASNDAQMLVSRQSRELSASSNDIVTTMKKHFDYTVDVTFDSMGGTACPSATYTLGQTYGELPTPTKSSYIFKGWYTALSNVPQLISFANNGTTADSCFKCSLPSDYSPVGTTMTFWGKNLGRTSEMTNAEDASMFFKIGNKSNGVGLTWQHNSNSTTFSLLEEGVRWNDTTIAGLNSWHHYAIVYNSQSNIVVYVDGVQKISTSTAMILPTQYFVLCGCGDPFYSNDLQRYLIRSLNGAIARVAIFNSTLTQAQVQADMELGLTLPNTSQLQHLWAYSVQDEIGNWNLIQVSPAYISSEVPQDFNDVKITEASLVDLHITTLSAHWQYADIGNDYTEYVVQTTSSYKKTGIYSATRYNSSSPIVVDWGDGNVEAIEGNISQLVHEYSSVGTFHVKISNISNFAASANNSTWYTTTSQNRYTFKDIVKTGSKCTTMPNAAFYYCSALSSISFLSSGFTSLTTVPPSAFYYCSGITTNLSSLPARIKTIGGSAFRYCTGLTGIQDLRNTGLTSFTNTYVFANCTNVKEFKLPSSIGATAGNYLFYQDTGLSAIQIPSSLTAVPNYMAYGCTHLSDITVPSNIKSINTYSFRGCTNLSSVTYETTALTTIGTYAFYQNYALQDLNVPDTVKSIGNYAFYYCYNTHASALALPSALTSIGTYAYQYCYNLKTLEIPSSLTSIGNTTFSGCRSLSSITDYRLTAQTVGANTFGSATGTSYTAYTGYSTKGSNVLWVLDGATGYDTGYWLDPLQNASKCGFNLSVIDGGGGSGGGGGGDVAETTISYYDGTTSSYSIVGEFGGMNLINAGIWDGPEMWAKEPVSVELGTDVTSIGNGAFYQRSLLTSLTIPNSVTAIGSYSVFEGVNADLVIPAEVTSIGTNAFYNYIGSNITFTGKTISYVQSMSSTWKLGGECQYGSGSINVNCSDGSFTVQYWPCFVKGTKILLEDGTAKNVEDLTYGDRLKTWNFDEGCQDSANICWLTRPGLKNDHYYKLAFSNGAILKTTGTKANHRVYNVDKRMFVGVDETNTGDRVYSFNGIVTVTSKEYIEEPVEYYNVITSKNINCFAEGILASCRLNNLYPIDSSMKYVKDNRPVRPYNDYEAVGISRYWYDNLRLGESTESIEKLKNYVMRCEGHMLPLEINNLKFGDIKQC